MYKRILHHIPDTLYHYCPMLSFFGIAQSRSLHLSLSKYSNDPEETQICIGILKKYMKTTCKIKASSFIDGINRSIGGDHNIYETINTPCIFCFSEESDSLPQWRQYGDNGKGIIFGFRPNQLNARYLFVKDTSLIIEKIFEEPYLGPCIYSEQEQEIIIHHFFIYFSSLFEKASTIAQEENIIANFMIVLNLIGAFFKRKDYESEKEWRLVVFPISNQANNKSSYKLNYKFSFELIRPYLEYPISDTIKNKGLSEIIIGSNVINSDHEISEFLYNHKISSFGRSRSKVKIQIIK